MARNLVAALILAAAAVLCPNQAAADQYCCGCPQDLGACERRCDSPGWCGGECGVVWCGTVGNCSGCSTHYFDGRHRFCPGVAAAVAKADVTESKPESKAAPRGDDRITITLTREEWRKFFQRVESGQIK